MIFWACSSVVLRGSVRAARSALYLSRFLMASSLAMARTTMSRPSSDLMRDLPELCARRVLGQLFVVAVDVGGVVELAGLAGHGAEELERRGHFGRCGEVVDKLGGEARVGEVFLDLLGVLLVVCLLGRIGLSGEGGRRREQKGQGEQTGDGWPSSQKFPLSDGRGRRCMHANNV